MANYTGKTCPFCKGTISAVDEVIVCPSCSTLHHKQCWNKNKGCAWGVCSEQNKVAQDTKQPEICKKCGVALSYEQDFCPKCGTPKITYKKKTCAKCGAELSEEHEFCTKCGNKVGITDESSDSSTSSQNPNFVMYCYD